MFVHRFEPPNHMSWLGTIVDSCNTHDSQSAFILSIIYVLIIICIVLKGSWESTYKLVEDFLYSFHVVLIDSLPRIKPVALWTCARKCRFNHLFLSSFPFVLKRRKINYQFWACILPSINMPSSLFRNNLQVNLYLCDSIFRNIQQGRESKPYLWGTIYIYASHMKGLLFFSEIVFVTIRSKSGE